MNVADVLKQKKGATETIEATAALRNAVERFTAVKVRCLVVTEGEKLVGMLTMRDILQHLDSAQTSSLEAPVRDVMTTQIATVTPEAALDEIQKIIATRHVNHVPVVDGEKLVGVVTLADVLRAHLDDVTALTAGLRQYIHGSYSM